ncbi:unnamed protein product [Paramecium primaurelia]|uniref:Uncharacterized protein n=3 Tax=Paramecium TaxID=5884 RepID=A0A8S1T1C4_PAROT|nr:unnamed protein product [Paramecium primaurelia]CAD8147095.1 unnamed protein product [Paramecium octaurelia]CAD8147810.1 unnamed protein product [Paramecium pentaurelia]
MGCHQSKKVLKESSLQIKEEVAQQYDPNKKETQYLVIINGILFDALNPDE